MASKSEKVVAGVKTLVADLMERVMNRVLVDDPFKVDKHRAAKPLYAALVPDEIFKGSHFERRFVTPFGRVWEQLAFLAAKNGIGNAELQKSITGNIPEERLNRIAQVLRNLEHPAKGKKKIKPNWGKELSFVLEGKGELIPTTVITDIYVKDDSQNKTLAFEIKAPLPNSDQTKVSKEKVLKLYAMEPRIISDAFFVLPYNPYGKRENYGWSFPKRWFDMIEDDVVLIGGEFWDLLGGAGTYDLFIKEINKLGKKYKDRIYREYLGIEPGDNIFNL